MCSMPTTLPLGPVYKQKKEKAIAPSHVLHVMPTGVGKYQVSNVCTVRNVQSLHRTYHPCKAGSEISTS